MNSVSTCKVSIHNRLMHARTDGSNESEIEAKSERGCEHPVGIDVVVSVAYNYISKFF